MTSENEMKRPLITLSALYERAILRAEEAWKEAQPEVRNGRAASHKSLRKYVLSVKRCDILKEMIKASVDSAKEDDFDEPLPARTCNLDDDECTSCQ